jgi:hypothetical protein
MLARKGSSALLRELGRTYAVSKRPCSFAPQHAPRLELQAASAERELDDRVHLRHRAVDRRDPGQRPDREALAARAQAAQQRLGHHGVTDPLRSDDEGVAFSGGRRNARPSFSL